MVGEESLLGRSQQRLHADRTNTDETPGWTFRASRPPYRAAHRITEQGSSSISLPLPFCLNVNMGVLGLDPEPDCDPCFCPSPDLGPFFSSQPMMDSDLGCSLQPYWLRSMKGALCLGRIWHTIQFSPISSLQGPGPFICLFRVHLSSLWGRCLPQLLDILPASSLSPPSSH